MTSKNNGQALMYVLVGLAAGFLIGWIFLVPPGTEVLEEGMRAVSDSALLVDEVEDVSQLTKEQISSLKGVLEMGRGEGDNWCGWPHTCDPRPACELLTEIKAWVEAADIKDPELRSALLGHVDRCLSDDLRCVDRPELHVCDIEEPKPCNELLDPIYVKAEDARDANTDEAWQLVSTEFEDFPAGRDPE